MKKDKESLPAKNTPKDYLAVRVQLVHVKTRFFGFTEKEIRGITCIPDDLEGAAEIMHSIDQMFSKYGKRIEGKDAE